MSAPPDPSSVPAVDHGRTTHLRALVRADTIDSTGALARDGVDAALRQRRHLAGVVESAARADGEVVATEGDGVVIACRSAVRALAVAQRLRSHARTAGLMIRIGVSIGDIVIEPNGQAPTSPGGDLARVDAVERAAEAGEIVVDDRVRRALVGIADVRGEPCEVPGVGGARRLAADAVVDDGAAATTEMRAMAFTRLAAPAERLHDDIARSIRTIHEVGGTVVDTNDAGHLAAFESVAGAFAAAEAIHGEAAASGLIEGVRVATEATMGIAVGEIALADDDDFGVAVVEAARLLRLGEPGWTVISDDVRAIGGIDGVGVEPLGEHDLKGIPWPVGVHRIALGRTPRPLIGLPPQLDRDQRFAFAGRTDLFAVLTDAWDEVVAGGRRGILVSGEEGAGKTRLAREVAHHVFRSGGIVLFGGCDEDLRVPYASVAEALRRAAVLDGDIAEAVGAGAGPIAPLFGRSADTRTHAVDRFDLFDAVTAALGRIAAQRPVMVVLDDVQWATPESLQLVEHALADPAPSRLMVVATCRSEDLSTDHPVEALLTSSRPDRRVAHLQLPRLDVAAVTEMLESRAGQPLRGDEIRFAREITTATGGSPLFVEELVIHLAATGVLVHDPGVGWQLNAESGSIPMPDSVVSLMSHRTARLGADAVSILTTAAVMGSSFDLGVLATVSSRSFDDVLDVIEVAEAARLVAEDDAGGTCSFTDEITRQALLRDLRPSRRALVHRTIAETLEERHPNRIDELALHWEAAIGDGAAERAIHHLRLAAERDMAAAAWESAVTRLRKVGELLDDEGCDDPEILGEVHYALGSSARMVGDETHRSSLVAAAGHARRTADGQLLARCAIGMMRPGAWYPEAAVIDTEISAMCEDALLLLDRDDPMRARVLAALATNLAYDDDVDRRRSLVAEAQQLAREIGDPRLIGDTLAAELIISFEPDRWERRWQLSNEVRAIARRTDNRDLAFTGGLFAMLELIMRGDIEGATALHAELREVAGAHRGYWQRFLTRHFDTAIAIARCVPNVTELIEAERAEFQDHPVDWFGVSVIQSAIVAMGQGTLSDMVLPFAAAVADDADNAAWSRKWNYAFSKAYHDSGDLDAAVAAIESNIEPDFDHYWLSSVYHLGQLGLSLGRTDYCELTVDRLAPYRGRLIIIGLGACIAGQVSTALGQAKLGLGEIDASEELFREAVGQASALGFPYFATLARRFLATALFRRDGASEEARDLVERVLRDAKHHGFAMELVAARELLAAADGPTAAP